MLTPLFDQYPGLLQRAENLPVEQLVPELAIEAFIVSILPWAAWFDKERLHADPLKPFPQGHGDKLWTIAHWEVRSWSPVAPITQAGGHDRSTGL